MPSGEINSPAWIHTQGDAIVNIAAFRTSKPHRFRSRIKQATTINASSYANISTSMIKQIILVLKQSNRFQPNLHKLLWYFLVLHRAIPTRDSRDLSSTRLNTNWNWLCRFTSFFFSHTCAEISPKCSLGSLFLFAAQRCARKFWAAAHTARESFRNFPSKLSPVEFFSESAYFVSWEFPSAWNLKLQRDPWHENAASSQILDLEFFESILHVNKSSQTFGRVLEARNVPCPLS